MNPKSASALAWASAIVIFLGLIVMSPAGRFMFCILGGVLALVPALLGPKVPRAAGGVMLALSVALAYQGYPAFEKERQDYRKRAESRSAGVPAQSPAKAQEQK